MDQNDKVFELFTNVCECVKKDLTKLAELRIGLRQKGRRTRSGIMTSCYCYGIYNNVKPEKSRSRTRQVKQVYELGPRSEKREWARH